MGRNRLKSQREANLLAWKAYKGFIDAFQQKSLGKGKGPLESTFW
jgi:hypothetical protein